MITDLNLDFYRPHLAECKSILEKMKIHEQVGGYSAFAEYPNIAYLLQDFQIICTQEYSLDRLDEMSGLEHAVLRSIDMLAAQVDLYRYRKDLVQVSQYQTSIQFVH